MEFNSRDDISRRLITFSYDGITRTGSKGIISAFLDKAPLRFQFVKQLFYEDKNRKTADEIQCVNWKLKIVFLDKGIKT